jgi:site-specific DNA-methyltransferase (adenine-specific)
MANMGDATADSVVSDPPYHLTSIVKRFGGDNAAPAQYGTNGAFSRASRGFMGQTWDGGELAFDPALWAEVLRVLKPGAFLLAFSGTRTYHRMACAIEDAGFEIRDMVDWLYGSGMPKATDLERAIAQEQCPHPGGHYWRDVPATAEPGAHVCARTPDSERYEGYANALKPAREPICMARKPLTGSLAANVLEWGTGGLNIDGCRVPSGKDEGRFPANVIHDGSDVILEQFPGEAGAQSPVHRRNGDKSRNVYNSFAGNIDEGGSTFHGDSGSAARFFYCAKASKADRDEGLEHLADRLFAQSNGAQARIAAGEVEYQGAGASTGLNRVKVRKNNHPTVKPTPLMRYLVRLVTPPGGLVFDPFAGSGSTGKAAMLEGFRFLGAEMTAEYIPIARERIAHAAGLTG